MSLSLAAGEGEDWKSGSFCLSPPPQANDSKKSEAAKPTYLIQRHQDIIIAKNVKHMKKT